MLRRVCARVLQQNEMFTLPISDSDGVNATDDHAVIGARFCHESRIVRLYGSARGLMLRAGIPSQGRVNWSVLILCEGFVDVSSQYSMFVMIQLEFGRPRLHAADLSPLMI